MPVVGTTRDLYLDPATHDLDLDDNGFLLLVSGAQAATQALKIALLIGRDEWPLDVDAGVPWTETPDADVLRAEILATAAAAPGIAQITSIQTSTTTDRTLSVVVQAETDQSETVEVGITI